MVHRSPPPPRQIRPALSTASLTVRLAGIAVVVATIAGAFAYVNGTFDPQRLTPKALVDVLEKIHGAHPGFRRNHAKGVCVVGYFESSGQAREFSSAQVFSEARTPVVGRFALPSGNPYAPDSSVPIRSLALRFTQANGQQWRTGMNSMPVFPVGTPEAFYQLLQASSPDPATGKPDPASKPAFLPRTRKPRRFCNGARPLNRRPATPLKPTTVSTLFIWLMRPASVRPCAGAWRRLFKTRREPARLKAAIFWKKICSSDWPPDHCVGS